MKNSRFNFTYRKNASVLHRAVGDALRNSKYSKYKIYQEFPVNRINTDFPSGREKFDWIIHDLKIVIECMGKQHYDVATFGKIDLDEAIQRYKAQKNRDKLKKEAAEEAGWAYIAIPYTDQKNIDAAYIEGKIKEVKPSTAAAPQPVAARSNEQWKEVYRQRKEFLARTGINEAQKKSAREYRKLAYQRAKQLQKEKGK